MYVIFSILNFQTNYNHKNYIDNDITFTLISHAIFSWAIKIAIYFLNKISLWRNASMKGDLTSWNKNFPLIRTGHTVLSDDPHYSLLQSRAKSNRIGLIIPSFIVRAYKKFHRSNKRVEEVFLSSAGLLNRVAIRESSSRRKAVVAHKESEWPRKLKVCGDEGMGEDEDIRRTRSRNRRY